ncbi:MAG: SH3 domain-containing protein [Candidatus Choladocola sp.]|nr:SH3 domain-containing protein [Candidatus Choladocola sp.]
MKNFKEWLSDYLRYFMLALAAVILFFIVFIGVKVYQNYDSPTAGQNIEILTEDGRITEEEAESEKISESEKSDETEKLSEVEEKKDIAETESQTEAETQRQSTQETQRQTTPETKPQTTPETQPQTVPETQPQTTPETQPPTEPEPVYKTLTGSCYLRSGPGYEYEIIGEYMYGTTVEFRGEVEGWYEVQVDGMIGYMGPRFFN